MPLYKNSQGKWVCASPNGSTQIWHEGEWLHLDEYMMLTLKPESYEPVITDTEVEAFLREQKDV